MTTPPTGKGLCFELQKHPTRYSGLMTYLVVAVRQFDPEGETFPVVASTTPKGAVPYAAVVTLNRGSPMQFKFKKASGLKNSGSTHCFVKLHRKQELATGNDEMKSRVLTFRTTISRHTW